MNRVLIPINHRYRGWRESSKWLDHGRLLSADLASLDAAVSKVEVDYRSLPYSVENAAGSLEDRLSQLMDILQQIRFRYKVNA